MGDYIIVGILYVALAAIAIKAHYSRKRDGREYTKNCRPVGRNYSGRWE